jgi:large subunit ribosomal protein L9
VVNYLLPREEILFYNDQNQLWVAKQKEKEARKNLFLTTKAQEFAAKINNLSLFFTLNKDKNGEPFGSVGSKEILTELIKSGFNLRKNQLFNFRPLHQLGEHLVTIKVRDDITAQIKIIID